VRLWGASRPVAWPTSSRCRRRWPVRAASWPSPAWPTPSIPRSGRLAPGACAEPICSRCSATIGIRSPPCPWRVRCTWRVRCFPRCADHSVRPSISSPASPTPVSSAGRRRSDSIQGMCSSTRWPWRALRSGSPRAAALGSISPAGTRCISRCRSIPWADCVPGCRPRVRTVPVPSSCRLIRCEARRNSWAVCSAPSTRWTPVDSMWICVRISVDWWWRPRVRSAPMSMHVSKMCCARRMGPSCSPPIPPTWPVSMCRPRQHVPRCVEGSRIDSRSPCGRRRNRVW